MKPSSRQRQASFLCLAASAVLPSGLHATEWRITPRVELRETYTDNVGLAARGQEESDLVTEIGPGVSITGRGPRLQLLADYTFRYRLYAKNSHANGHNHSLRSTGLLDVWDRKLFLEGAAYIAQQDISTLGPRTTSDININSNRTEVRQGTLSPYWVSRLGNFANLNARYTWNRVDSDGETEAASTETNGISLNLSNGPMFNDFGWSTAYSLQKIDSTQGQFEQRTVETISGTVSYRLLPTLTGFVTVGRDDNDFGDVQGSTGGSFHSFGLQWAPSARTNIRAEIGKRYFGDTAAFYGEHRTRLTTWILSYSEDIVATPGLLSTPTNLDTTATLDRLFLSQVPDPIERQQAVQAFIVQNGLPPLLPSQVDFLTNEVSLSKRLSGTFGMRGVRGTLLLNVFHENRDRQTTGATPLGTDPFSLSDTVTQVGYNAILTWRFSQRTAGSVSLGQTKAELTDVNRKDINSNFRVGMTHQLQPKLVGSIEYRFLNRDTNSSAGDVRENAITGTLNLAF